MPGHGSLAPIKEAFDQAENKHPTIFCRHRWLKVYKMLIARQFNEVKIQIKKWKNSGVLNEEIKVIEKIDELIAQKPSSIG